MLSNIKVFRFLIAQFKIKENKIQMYRLSRRYAKRTRTMANTIISVSTFWGEIPLQRCEPKALYSVTVEVISQPILNRNMLNNKLFAKLHLSHPL